MLPKRSKKIAQKSGQADQQPAAALTPEEISVALAQLLEGQRQTQQQIEELLAQQASVESAGPRPEGAQHEREPSRFDGRTQG